MTLDPVRSRRRRTAALALVTATLVPGLAQLPALATSTAAAPAPLGADDVTTLADSVPGLSDLDARGSVLPSLAQRRVAEDLGAVSLRWNDFGTPGSLLPADGALARAYGTSSPGRVRRLIDYMEKLGVIVARTDFSGKRSIGLPGLGLSTAAAEG